MRHEVLYELSMEKCQTVEHGMRQGTVHHEQKFYSTSAGECYNEVKR